MVGILSFMPKVVDVSRELNAIESKESNFSLGAFGTGLGLGGGQGCPTEHNFPKLPRGHPLQQEVTNGNGSLSDPQIEVGYGLPPKELSLSLAPLYHFDI
ncbi:hypothetical protein TNCV_2289671 [Trichonephila clavipes]|uniref:Uncharacterized protein n=1 Tax=Trichonephila clavipes TaxID=2585209 RepID=A0A8X6V5U9_TRICX|nr:hypothetical protein TNCV_2289671 [Trichonephila clavipes]